MKFLNEGEQIEVQGSGKNPYIVKKSGGVVSCSCPAWRNLGGPIDNRVCKHIKANIDQACLLPQAQTHVMIEADDMVGPAALTAVSAAIGPTSKITIIVPPPLLLAHSFEEQDPTGWWMSEKLDGVRAWWDGTKIVSRLGNEYHAPDWFKRQLPNVVLDGELFAGQGKFQNTVSVVRKLVPCDLEWQEIRFLVFDAPEHDKPFEERQKYIRELWTEQHGFEPGELSGPYVWEPLTQVRCSGRADLDEYLKVVEAEKGEGVMLRAPGSRYVDGRSTSLLKVKTFHDAEGIVVSHEPGKGKHKGRMGALMVQMADGTTFKVGSGFTDKERENPPKIGTQITYRYQELTNAGVPRFPTFVSARDYE